MNKTSKAVIAGAVASLFSTMALAADKAAPKKDDAATTVQCANVNECKAKGACGGASHDCAGKNECKGKGWISLTEKDCKAKGGSVVAKK